MIEKAANHEWLNQLDQFFKFGLSIQGHKVNSAIWKLGAVERDNAPLFQPPTGLDQSRLVRMHVL